MGTTRFKFLIGDVNWSDHGGKFYRRVEKGATPAGGRFHIMEIMRWPENEEHLTGRYNVSLAEVDLDAATEAQLRGALNSVGIDDLAEVESDPRIQALIKLDALHSYGEKAPLWDQSGNNYNKLMAEARAESAALDDPAAHEDRMFRPVNAIGSTAREFMQGDIRTALDRIGGMTKTLSGCETKRLAFAISFQRRTDDTSNPIAYVMGYLHGLSGAGLQTSPPRERTDGAYFDGYRHAVDVKSKRKDPPTWAKEWRP
jgi:hypothetical protein